MNIRNFKKQSLSILSYFRTIRGSSNDILTLNKIEGVINEKNNWSYQELMSLIQKELAIDSVSQNRISILKFFKNELKSFRNSPINPETYKITGCFMDDAKRFAFIHIYKNASISLRNILEMRGNYYEYEEAKRYSPDTICIIRNPFDRVISSYLYLLRLEDNGFPNQHPVHLTKESYFYKTKDNPIESFKTFLNAIKYDNFYDAVTYPQVNFLKDRGLTIDDIDNVFIQENIEEDFKEFKIKYDLDKNLIFPKDNRSDDKVTKLLKEFVKKNKLVQKEIIKLYKEDIIMYNRVCK